MSEESRHPLVTIKMGPHEIRPGVTAFFFIAPFLSNEKGECIFIKFRPKVLCISRELLEHFQVNDLKFGDDHHPDFKGEPQSPRPELMIHDIFLEAGKQISLSVTSISKTSHDFSATIVGEVA
jgi:hypothetical protein